MALPTDFWDQERDILMRLLLPRIEGLALAGSRAATERLSNQGVFFDDTLAHTQAAAWARKYTDELLARLETTNMQVVGQILSNWVETPGATIGDLSGQLEQALDVNRARAQLIGDTEVTRAFNQGDALAYREAGLPQVAFAPPAHPRCRCFTTARQLPNDEWVIVWQTNRDELVCVVPFGTPWGRVQGCRQMVNVIVSEGQFMGRKYSEAARDVRNAA